MLKVLGPSISMQTTMVIFRMALLLNRPIYLTISNFLDLIRGRQEYRITIVECPYCKTLVKKFYTMNNNDIHLDCMCIIPRNPEITHIKVIIEKHEEDS